MLCIAPDFVFDRGKKLAEHLNLDVGIVQTKSFPNGEVLARVLVNGKSLSEEDILLFFPTYPDTNNRVLLLFQTLEILNSMDVGSITLILPYLSYSRQDKRFLDGESLSLKLFLDLLYDLGVKKLISIDVHNVEAVKKFAKMEVDLFSLFTPLMERVKESFAKDEDFILVAPDEGRLDVVKSLAEMLHSRYIYFEKSRDRYTGEVSFSSHGLIDSEGVAVIVDDEISSGGTVSKVSTILRENFEGRLIAAAIHLLLVGSADERLFASGINYIVGTNTIENPYYVLEVEEYLAERLKWIN
jgi:ribose-phosphate pyrophosphokinase